MHTYHPHARPPFVLRLLPFPPRTASWRNALKQVRETAQEPRPARVRGGESECISPGSVPLRELEVEFIRLRHPSTTSQNSLISFHALPRVDAPCNTCGSSGKALTFPVPRPTPRGRPVQLHTHLECGGLAAVPRPTPRGRPVQLPVTTGTVFVDGFHALPRVDAPCNLIAD